MTPVRNTSDKPSVCFVAHNAYGALAGLDTGHAGGIERQQSLLARELVQRGWSVQMITLDEGQADGEIVDGVRVIKMCRREAGLPVLRFVHPKWTSLWRALRQADADVYYYNCGDLALGQLAKWCRRHERKCVYSAASDADCDARLPALKPLRERVLFRYGLRHADRILVQTGRQQQMLRDGFGLDATIVPMACLSAAAGDLKPPTLADKAPPHVLWVGRFSQEKRLEWLLELAARCPQWHFNVVGAANSVSEYSDGLLARAGALTNVTLHGRVVHAEIARFYQRAAVLCCTSEYEGFPNTFLEAWSHRLPIVSTFDPDHLIERRELGRVAQSVPELAAALDAVLTDAGCWQRCSDNGYRYFRENHTLDAVLLKYEAVFHEVTGRDRCKRGPAEAVRATPAARPAFEPQNTDVMKP